MKILIGSIKKARELCTLAKKYSAKILITDTYHEIDATSLIGIFSLNLIEELTIKVVSDNQEEIETIMSDIRKIGLGV